MQRFEQIYAEHVEAVRSYVRRRAPESIVDDVVSDTFLVCLAEDRSRAGPSPLPWLYAVARKTLANERRRQARAAHGHAVPAGEPAPVDDGELATAFNDLSARDREVLRLVAWEGLPLADAATVLGCSAVACRVRYHRAGVVLGNEVGHAASRLQPAPGERRDEQTSNTACGGHLVPQVTAHRVPSGSDQVRPRAATTRSCSQQLSLYLPRRSPASSAISSVSRTAERPCR